MANNTATTERTVETVKTRLATARVGLKTRAERGIDRAEQWTTQLLTQLFQRARTLTSRLTPTS